MAGRPKPPVVPVLPSGQPQPATERPVAAADQPGQPRATNAPPAAKPGRDTPGPTADPDPALLEPASASTTDLLPRIAADGRMPMQVYASGFDASSRRPRVGVVLAGLGLNQADIRACILHEPGRCFGFRAAPCVIDDHVGAGFGKAQRDGSADAGRRTRDHRGFSAERALLQERIEGA